MKKGFYIIFVFVGIMQFKANAKNAGVYNTDPENCHGCQQ